MFRFKSAIILAVMALGATVAAQTAPQGSGPDNQATASLVQITEPPAGAKLAQTFVSVHYQISNPTIATADSPNFRVQLDGQDPIMTTSTSQDFTGLTPGQHTVTVQLVDANNTPVPGGGASVKFTILNPTPQSDLVGRVLPSGSSPLPLLSVIGFGVLLGGLVSAMRTRSRY
ncbi:MAG TPA: hypothetical protein VKB56_07745 [Terriglobales bacterium]|nr:hypothetical protein [Terriglobales bacterium]